MGHTIMEPKPFNPYRHLAKNANTLLNSELKLRLEDREHIEWLMRVEFAGTKIQIGKGGANTCYWTLGDGKRRIDYPNKMLMLLDRLGRQTHPYYAKIGLRGERTNAFFLSSLRDQSPDSGDRLVGISVDSIEETLYRARRNARNILVWKKQVPAS
jgi:hypothetical protein